MHRRGRVAAALVALGGVAALTVACATVLGLDDVGYGADAGAGPNDATADVSDAAAGDAGAGDTTTSPTGCGPNTKVCIVCVPDRSVATGCDPKSCESCRVGPHADAACSGTQCVVAACQAPFADCDGVPANGCETGTRRGDPANCGACRQTCDAGLLCQPDGGCALTCESPRVECDGGRADVQRRHLLRAPGRQLRGERLVLLGQLPANRSLRALAAVCREKGLFRGAPTRIQGASRPSLI